jgi:hypothetical protein
MSVAAGTCSPIRCPETPVSRSLHSNGTTRHISPSSTAISSFLRAVLATSVIVARCAPCVSSSGYLVRFIGVLNNELKRMWTKRSWVNCRWYPGICLKGLRQTVNPSSVQPVYWSRYESITSRLMFVSPGRPWQRRISKKGLLWPAPWP